MEFMKLEVFIPVGHEETIVEALNAGGFIQDNDYDYCYATSLVKGHFRPLKDADPYIGQTGNLTEVDEIKLECRIHAQKRKEVEAVVRLAHPYEIPVMNFIPLA